MNSLVDNQPFSTMRGWIADEDAKRLVNQARYLLQTPWSNQALCQFLNATSIWCPNCAILFLKTIFAKHIIMRIIMHNSSRLCARGVTQPRPTQLRKAFSLLNELLYVCVQIEEDLYMKARYSKLSISCGQLFRLQNIVLRTSAELDNVHGCSGEP